MTDDEILALDSDKVIGDKSSLMERVQKKVEQAKKQASGLGKPLDEFAAMSQTDKIKDAIKKLREARRMDMGSGREGDVRTAVRQFLQKEFETGRLDIPDAYEKKMITEVRQGGVDPIDVFRKAYGEDALIAVDDIFDQYGDALRGPTYRDIEENFRKLFRMNRGFYDEAALPIPKKEYGFDEGVMDNDQFAEKLQQQLRQLEELEDFTPPTDRKPNAEGGLMRTSYAYGSGFKLATLLARKGKNLKEEIKKAIDNIFPSGDSKYDADVALDNMLEDLNIDRDTVDGYDVSKAYGEAYDMLTAQRGLRSTKVPGAVRPGTVLSPAEELKKEFPGITDDMIKTILIDDNPQRIAEVKQTMREAFTMIDKGMGMDEIMDILAKTKRTKQATGGRVRAASGGLARILNL